MCFSCGVFSMLLRRNVASCDVQRISYVENVSKVCLLENHVKQHFDVHPGGGGYSHIHAIWVCATVKGMVFKLFSLG